MSTEKTFPCTKCGACCVLAGLAGWMPAGESGACKYLGEDNLCTVYETRPDLCRVDKMREYYNMDKTYFYQKQALFCNTLQEELNISEDFRVEV